MHALLVIGLLLLTAEAAAGQDTREAEIASEQAEKATDLHPYEMTPLERRIQQLEDALLNPPPVYVFIGSVMRGGLLAAGPGYRGTFGDTGRFDTHAAWSLRNYKIADASARLPELADGLVIVDLRASWLDAPKVAFYGTGDRSSLDNKTSFLYRATTAGVVARLQATPIAAAGVGIDLLDARAGRGTAGTSIEQVFASTDLPGVGANPRYAKTQVFAEVDWRQSPGYTRRGGLYRVEWNNYRQTEDGPYSFRRVDAEIDQFIPLLRENWVIALRALASSTQTDAGQHVPFFLLPDLGGSRELRGYPSWRFRDRHRLLLTGEYRWTAGQFVDMALFFDAGKTAPRWADLDVRTLATTYGIGVRFHTPTATAMRIELAHTHEGLGLVFAFGPSF